MRKITLLGLSLLVAGIATAGNVTGKVGERFKRMNAAGRSMVSVPGMNDRTTKTLQLQRAGMLAKPEMSPRRVAEAAGDGPVAELNTTKYGMMYGPDGDTWFFSQETTVENYYYKTSDIVIYDSNHNEAGHINWTCPEGKNVNTIYPYGQVTRKMFDNDDKTQEVVVFVHYVVSPGVTLDSTYIYNLQGEVVRKYEGQIVDVISIKQNEWSTLQRAILQRQAGNLYDEGEVNLYFDVLKPMSRGDTEPTVEHTFAVPFELTNYCEGPCFSICDIDNEPYYVLSHYREPYVEGYDLETWEMIVRENNEYVIDVYDKDYAKVDSFGVKLDKPEEALYRMAAFSMFSDNDMSKNFYTDNGELNYVVTYYDYYTSSDEFVYTFQVFDGNGKLKKTICENATEGAWFQLSDLRGHEEQWGFLQTVGTTQQVRMVDVPSCETAVILPAQLDGENISLTLDRYPKGDSYQYAISLANGDADDAGNVLARIAWYNKDLTLDHYVTFNLGPNAQYFTPLLTYYTLNPYLFDTDDEHEYPFLAKIMRTDGSKKIDNVMAIGKEDGTVIREFRGDDDNSLYSGGVLNYDTNKPEFYTVTENFAEGTYHIEMYSLPFTKFAAGGDGTAENPYLISTLGDMQQMKTEPTANYRLAADIDMTGYPTTWTPVENFTGTLDGDGHTLSNFVIGSETSEVGLFGMLGDGSKVKDLTIINPVIELNGNNSYAGIISGHAVGDTISNVHIYGAVIKGDNGATVGGFVGQPALYSEISGSSFEGTINVPGADNVGGIAGETRTSSNVVACSVKGSLTAASSLGGIVGTTGTDSKVLDCHADVTMEAKNTVGGIVGTNGSRAAVSRNYVSGTISATSASQWSGLSLGGIVGYLEADWSNSSTAVVNGNVMTAELLRPVTEEVDETVNRIVGWTIANESYEPGEKVQTDAGLADNYTTFATLFNGTVTDDATSVNGASIEKSELTTEFFKGLGYAYGTTKTEPWKETSATPVLWFENVAMGIAFSQTSLTMSEGETAEITVTVYGTDASEIDLQSSDNEVVSFEIIDETDNSMTISIECKKAGTAVITATAGDAKAECVINSTTTGIDAIGATAANLSIRIAEGRIEAAGASRMALYNAAGQLAARSAGDAVSTAGMAKGVYVVVATNSEGRTKTSKVVVK